MGFFIFIIAILIIIFVIKEVVKGPIKFTVTPVGNSNSKTESVKQTYPFKKKKFLMTQTEYKFFGVLHEIIKDKYFIMPQVALSRIIEVENGHSKYGPDSWQSNFNRINKKTVDFVIFDKIHLSPLLVIELDDYTHNYFSRQERDDFLDGALKSASLNILHIKPQYAYDTAQLEQAIFSQLKV